MDICITCDYCKEGLIVPYSLVEKLLHKYIKNYNSKNKLTNYQIGYLKMLIKICPCIESYILFNLPDLYKLLGPLYYSTIPSDASYFLKKLFLHDRTDASISQMVKCNYCGKEACSFHINYGGYKFGNCDMTGCNRHFSICGWCQEKLLNEFKNKCICCFKFLWDSKNKQLKLNKLVTSSIYS